jgi:hypothetical protein
MGAGPWEPLARLLEMKQRRFFTQRNRQVVRVLFVEGDETRGETRRQEAREACWTKVPIKI